VWLVRRHGNAEFELLHGVMPEERARSLERVLEPLLASIGSPPQATDLKGQTIPAVAGSESVEPASAWLDALSLPPLLASRTTENPAGAIVGTLP